ncbi:MAG: ribosomal protein S18-alanine N-acetyltransferase [Clostridia bacterium]|nr:ribosomal protein S18-alanine N-acetyltransferase [Clostridia bacterium]
MTAAHIETVACLEQACFSAPWSAASLAEELENPLAVFRVAVDGDGQILGYMGMHHVGDEGFVTNVAVFPAARRRGVAAALLAHMADYAAAHRLYRITLEVRLSNTAAIALYEGAGYVRDGVRPAFYRNPTEDAAIYSRYFQ